MKLYSKQNGKFLGVKRAITSSSDLSVQLYGKDKGFNDTVFLVLKQDLLRKNLRLLFQLLFTCAIFQRYLNKVTQT